VPTPSPLQTGILVARPNPDADLSGAM
jgi:hypothetical protein